MEFEPRTIRNACIAIAILGLPVAAPLASAAPSPGVEEIGPRSSGVDGPCIVINPWVWPPFIWVTNDPLNNCI